VARELAELEKLVDDSSEDSLEATLKACRSCVRSILPPAEMLDEIEDAMLDAGIEPPEDEERWTSAWGALAGGLYKLHLYINLYPVQSDLMLGLYKLYPV
jgi:hypothetical protein